jgi:hypothetical protein
MEAAWTFLIMALCVWAAVVGSLIGRDIVKWFWRDDE